MSIFSLNATLIAELVLFAVVAVVVAKVVIPPLRRAMDERQAAITKGLDDARAAEERLAQADLEYERLVAAARRQARDILDTYQAMASEAAERARADERLGVGHR